MSQETRVYTFSVRFESKWGQNVYVVGAVPELGNWKPSPKLRMVYKDKALWTLTLTVPAKEIIYSYIVLDDFDPNAPILWEPRIDRTLKVGQVSTIDDWGVGSKVQQIQLPQGLTIWRCPMPFSRMFDPSGTIHEQLESSKITAVACLAHREELEYHTNHQLLEWYQNKGITVHLYEVDDMCLPSDPDEFTKFAKAIIDLIRKGSNVCVHCHSGTGRTGLFIATIWKLLTNEPAYKILEDFNNKFHGVLLTPECEQFLDKIKSSPVS